MKEQRQFTIKHLRNLGYGKSSSEPLIQEEILKLLKFMMPIKGHQDKTVHFKHLFRQHNVNIIWAFVFGTSFDDDEAAQFSESARSKALELQALNVFTSYLLPIPGPILRFIPAKILKQLGIYSKGYEPLSRMILVKANNFRFFFVFNKIVELKANKQPSHFLKFVKIYFQNAIENRMSKNIRDGHNFIDIYIEEIMKQQNKEGSNSSFTSTLKYMQGFIQ